MRTIRQINFNKVKNFLKKLPRTMGEHVFLTSLVFIVLALIFGGLIFYKYSILAEGAEPEVFEKPLQFEEKTYQEILKIWQEREKKFEETESKTYPNPF